MHIEKENTGPKPKKVAGGRITAVSTVHYPMNGKPYPIRKGFTNESYIRNNNESKDLDMDAKELLKSIGAMIDSKLDKQATKKEVQSGNEEAPAEEAPQDVKKEMTPEDQETVKAMIEEAVAPLKEQITALEAEVESLKAASDMSKSETEEVKASLEATEKSYNETLKSMKTLVQKALDVTPAGNQSTPAPEAPVKKGGNGHVMLNSPIHKVLVNHNYKV